MSDKTGGPAFPVAHPDMVIPGQSVKETQGMTLRDYFAKEAMAVVMVKTTEVHIYADGERHVHYQDMDQTAAAAYRMADAMLKAREN
jgi:hypothetical protein